VIVAVPMALLGVLLINTSRLAMRDSVLNDHKEIIVRASKEIELYINRPQDVLITTAAVLEKVEFSPWQQETILVDVALNRPDLIWVSSVDLSGKEIASSELGGNPDRKYPTEALREVTQDKIYISKVKILGNHTPFITIAVPIKQMGKIVGGLFADINLKNLWDIVDNIKIGRTGRAFLVSGDGILITHPDKKLVLKNENTRNRKDVQLALVGKTGAIELSDERGKKWISSYAPILNMGWGIVLRQAQDEAFLFSTVVKAESWIIIILSEFLVILVSIFMARVLSRPINSLASRIKGVAAGEFDGRIETKRRDEIGELIRSFNYMNERLKKARTRERLSAIGEASARISHEFKNSLIAIKSFVQLFPQKHRDKKFVDMFSKLVPAEIKRWEHMLKELSDFSSRFELVMDKADLKKIIDGVLEIMKEEFVKKKINLKYAAEEDDFYLMADAERLRQVFMNLIINAINAMPQGGELSVSINSGSLNRPSYIEVRIKDTGIGIQKESLSRIFEPFHTTKRGGMGLGLYISRRIIEKHGGNIKVESQSGIGTTFIVRLPGVITESKEEKKITESL
jgi:two-component system NtrC family sensor kinase